VKPTQSKRRKLDDNDEDEEQYKNVQQMAEKERAKYEDDN